MLLLLLTLVLIQLIPVVVGLGLLAVGVGVGVVGLGAACPQGVQLGFRQAGLLGAGAERGVGDVVLAGLGVQHGGHRGPVLGHVVVQEHHDVVGEQRDGEEPRGARTPDEAVAVDDGAKGGEAHREQDGEAELVRQHAEEVHDRLVADGVVRQVQAYQGRLEAGERRQRLDAVLDVHCLERVGVVQLDPDRLDDALLDAVEPHGDGDLAVVLLPREGRDVARQSGAQRGLAIELLLDLGDDASQREDDASDGRAHHDVGLGPHHLGEQVVAPAFQAVLALQALDQLRQLQVPHVVVGVGGFEVADVRELALAQKIQALVDCGQLSQVVEPFRDVAQVEPLLVQRRDAAVEADALEQWVQRRGATLRAAGEQTLAAFGPYTGLTVPAKDAAVIAVKRKL